MKTSNIIIGVIGAVVAIWQFYQVAHYWRWFQKKADQTTSPFSGIAIWFSLFIAVVAVFASIMGFSGQI
ncbi:hypothetical protein PQ472_01025 [Lacticaseibacillus pabuli]|uniref:Immunity protein 17 of polymorphic toxin system n=1 Tax=Lacticaseibacillus pabuli TaxID=3025672 RepID=A0ABY7WY55_9LACO|nr:hypothetical protein [Lacticaseibacillus sp. KACC 23028]WDF82855.1 hypothetical protein PQ472_01025 [Lacticaseibacillus sp. KACC 23028]